MTTARIGPARRTDTQRLRVICLGYIVRGSLGGMAWSDLQYLIGLRRLGHDVYFVEDSGDHPSCYDPDRNITSVDPSYGLRFARDELERIGMGDRWAYYDAHSEQWHGPRGASMVEIARSADVVLNLAAVNPLRPWFADVPVRALVDQDPVFTQARIITDKAAHDHALAHNAYFSFGENVGVSKAAMPADGISWQPTRQPIDAGSLRPRSVGKGNGAFTTVMIWESYPPREIQGVRYGTKADSFDPYLTLPAETSHRFLVALGGATAPRAVLEEHGWLLADPIATTRDVPTYLSFIRDSMAEFSVAKQAYVISHSGWFSERSVAYLASSRPVVVQDTGFTEWLESGRGVLAFRTREEADDALDQVAGDYERHRRHARDIAIEYFDYRVVLASLLERALMSPVVRGEARAN
jgi:hypothetical protein